MRTENRENRKTIKSVCSKAKLCEYISDCSFEHEHDAEILSRIYLQHQDCGYIADKIGLSYSQTIERHRQAAKRLADLIKTR